MTISPEKTEPRKLQTKEPSLAKEASPRKHSKPFREMPRQWSVKDRKYLEEFMTALYPEDVNPHTLYLLQDKLEHLQGTMVRWNAKRISDKNVVEVVWNLFEPIIRLAWVNRRKEILGESE